jgi:DNA invertase Pin-like site-specific DNA recombinase
VPAAAVMQGAAESWAASYSGSGAATLSGLLRKQVSIRASDMPGADDLMMRAYAAMAQKERELISERTRAALTTC